MIIKLQRIAIILFSMLFIMSCDSDDSNDEKDLKETETAGINIEEAFLKDFPLFGIEQKSIDITKPVIKDNKEVTYGEIKITLPSTASLDGISIAITSDELNLSKFFISPGNDASLSFKEDRVQVFTINSTIGNKEALIHYNVSIIKEEPAIAEVLKLTSFTFEESKNKGIIPNDITISKRVDIDTSYERIFLLVPVGTDFTKLVPTLTYEGANLYYSQDSSIAPVDMNTQYPAGDPSFNFEYPRDFFLTIKDKDNNKIKLISVIVDVVNPVKIERPSITLPDVTKGTSEKYFIGETKWTNQGNHPIRFYKRSTYEDVEPSWSGGRLNRVIVVNRKFPSRTLAPGDSRDIDIILDSNNLEGTYKTTAVFYTKIFADSSSDDLFDPSKVTVTTKIVK